MGGSRGLKKSGCHMANSKTPPLVESEFAFVLNSASASLAGVRIRRARVPGRPVEQHSVTQCHLLMVTLHGLEGCD